MGFSPNEKGVMVKSSKYCWHEANVWEGLLSVTSFRFGLASDSNANDWVFNLFRIIILINENVGKSFDE